jgi:ATP-dependent Clp protease protease subunit
MNFRYIRNYSNQEATMLIYDEIGGDGIDGNYFAKELFYLDESGCKKVNVRINSPGGSVIDGYSIFSAIINTKCKVTTYNDGCAASISGVIFLAGKKRIMADYATFMMHNPAGPVENAVDLTVINLIKEGIKTILSNRSKVTPEMIDGMMNQVSWFDSSQCLEHGFADEVYSTVNKPQIEITDSVESIWAITNKFLNQSTNMFEKVTNALGLQSGANEESVVVAISGLTNSLAAKAKEVETLTNSVSTLTNSLTELTAKLKEKEDAEKVAALALATNKAETLITEAVKVGKIANTAKDAWVALAVENFESTKTLIDGIPVQKAAMKIEDVDNEAPVVYTMAAQMAEIRNKTSK